MSLLTLISLFLPEFSEYKLTEVYIGIPLFAVIGITLFCASFIKRDPYKVGVSTSKNALTYRGETEICYFRENIQEIPEKNKQIEYKAN